MRRHPFSRRPTPPLVTVLIIAVLIGWRWYSLQPVPHPPSGQSGEFVVKRAVDGDTLLLTDGNRVRLIGVDTPETKHPDLPVQPFGPEASEFTRSRVEGKQVRLEFDKERLDQHGRVLAYVYFQDRFLNEELIRAGMGRAVTHFPYSAAMKRRFRSAETKAREEQLGIWSVTAPVPDFISK